MRMGLVFCFITSSMVASAAPHLRAETISGQVVAYSSFPSCVNGNTYWSMVIRRQHRKDIRFNFIRVEFSVSCGDSPDWLLAKQMVQKFRLSRLKGGDTLLKGTLYGNRPRQNPELPIWRYPPGAEHLPLPFGQVLPCYRSVELPLAPVL